MSGPSLGSILATRQGSLVLALLCAVCAAGVLVFALGRYKSNVQQPVPQATVLVATGEIAKGTVGSEIAAKGLYKPTPVATTSVTPGALTDAAQLSSATASSDILPGQQLTSTDFSTIVNAGEVLKPNQRALEISVSGANGAVDITQPGSRVDIYLSGDTGSPSPSATGSPPASGGATKTTVTSPPASTGATKTTVIGTTGTTASAPATSRLLVSNVLVLKPATATPVTIGNQSVAGGTLVLALNNSQVPEMIANSGSLYLALRPSTKPASSNPTTPKAAAQ
jgi:Flp pilus assembly protein CpaB